MNKIYCLIWNHVTGTWVAAAETARRGGKQACRAILLATAGSALALSPAMVQAQAAPAPPAATQLPTGGKLVAGQATIGQDAAVMSIRQSSARAAIDWQSFDVGSQARVNFLQPSAASVTLNRVGAGNPSQIFGRITAPGQVYLTNPSGIYFAPGASVDVGALVATTHSIGNDDFMAGNSHFTRDGATGSVVNAGHITAALGGYIALLAPQVRNEGVIVAQLGTVALAAGEAVELQFDGNHALVQLRVDASDILALVANGNAVQAPGGLIILSAQAANTLQGGGIINNSGVLESSGLVRDGGRIILQASASILHSGRISADAAVGSDGNGGTALLIASLANAASTARVDGSISAHGGDAGGNGGFVETSAAHVTIGDRSRVDTRAPLGRTGRWLIDPDGFTIAASGGDISGATLSSNLDSSDVSILSVNGGGSDGHVNVNDTVTWSAHTLTLTASKDIRINAVMSALGTASLDLAVDPGNGQVLVSMLPDGGFKGRIDFLQADGSTPRTGSGMLTINGNPYTVISALGAEGSTTGLDLQGIAGDLNGRYALGSNIDASATGSTWADTGFAPLGTDGHAFAGVLDGLGHAIDHLVIDRAATNGVGLIGVAVNGVVRNLGLVDAAVTGGTGVGALVGSATVGRLSNNYASGTITGDRQVGGLIGYNNTARTQSSHFDGIVSGTSQVGGLMGETNGGVDNRDNHARGTVMATGGQAGGLIGNNGFAFNVHDSSASVNVSGRDNVGGLVGYNRNGDISNSHATGDVLSSGNYVGGLVGYASGGTVRGSYATGNVSGTGTYYGGLVGVGFAPISDSYATGNISGSVVGGLVGIQFMSVSNSYASGAVNAEGGSYRGGLIALLDSGDVTNSYWNTTTSGMPTSAGGIGRTTEQLHSAATFDGWDFGNTWVIYEGHTAPLLRGSMTPLSVGSIVKIYDGQAVDVADLGLPSSNLFGALSLAGSAVAAVNAGSYSLAGSSGLYSNQQGYIISYDGTLVIGQRPITVLAGDQSKTYGQADPALTWSLSAGSLVAGDSLTGALTRGAGENVGNYGIDVSALANGNYLVTGINGVLTILPVEATAVIPPAPSPAVDLPVISPAINQPVPAVGRLFVSRAPTGPGISLSGIAGVRDAQGAGGVLIFLQNMPDADGTGLVGVSIPRLESAPAGGFSFVLPARVSEMLLGGGADVRATTLTGGPLPGWLAFDRNTLRLAATSIPEGGLPLQFQVSMGSTRFTIDLSEQVTN